MSRLLCAFLCACAALLVRAGPLEDARAAYERGDRDAALRFIAPLAEKGQAEVQSLIGHIFYDCAGHLPDYPLAARWFRKAADQGHRLAQFNLGNLYYFGRGVPQDRAEAAKLLLSSAEQGLAAAQLNLGYMYQQGHGVPQDNLQAYRWLTLAAAPNPASGVPAKALQIRAEVAANMTPAQIAEATALAQAARR